MNYKFFSPIPVVNYYHKIPYKFRITSEGNQNGNLMSILWYEFAKQLKLPIGSPCNWQALQGIDLVTKHTHHSGWSCMFHVHLRLERRRRKSHCPLLFAVPPLQTPFPSTVHHPLLAFVNVVWPCFTVFAAAAGTELPLNYGNLFCPKERSSKTTTDVQWPTASLLLSPVAEP